MAGEFFEYPVDMTVAEARAELLARRMGGTFTRRDEMAGMDFGSAIKGLKQGFKLTRSGWNGKGMYIYHVPEGRYPPSTPAGDEIAVGQEDGRVPYRAYIAMRTVTGEVVPWLASQTDVLAEDWELV